MRFVFFPLMHAELIPPGLPEEVRLLDPGVAGSDQEASPRFWKPEGLPLDRKQASKFLAESIDFGERFHKPSDLHYFAAAELEDYYSQTSMSIRSEFRRAAGLSKAGSGAEEQSQARMQAQMTLLLAWRLEESVLEYDRLNQDMDDSWGRFRQNLGLEDEDPDFSGPGRASGSSSDQPYLEAFSWPQLLIWFSCLLDRDDALVLTDGHIRSEWSELGLSLQPLAGSELVEFGLGTKPGQEDQALALRAPGWRLARLDAPDPARPWLDSERLVICLSRG